MNYKKVLVTGKTHWLARKKPRCAFISAYPCQYSQTPAAMAATAAMTSIIAVARPVFDAGVCADPGSLGVGRRVWRRSDEERRDSSTARRRWDNRLRSSIAKSLPALPTISCSFGIS